MFRRYPYWGWLVASLALWGCCIYQYRFKSEAIHAGKLGREMSRDIAGRISAFEKLSKDEQLIDQLCGDSLSADISRSMQNVPFYLFAYNLDTLRYWNTNSLIATPLENSVQKYVLTKNENGIFLERCIPVSKGDNRHTLVALLPIKIAYPLENSYLHSHFVAGEEIPADTRILPVDSAISGSYPIPGADGKPLFCVKFYISDNVSWIPDSAFMGLLLLAVFCSMLWSQLLIIYLNRRTNQLVGLVVTVVYIGVILTLFYVPLLPFNLKELPLFDSRLYASSQVLPSFGTLIADTFCALWLLVYLSQHPVKRSPFTFTKNKAIIHVCALLLMGAVVFLFNVYIYIIRSLILDSRISFDVSHFYAINLFSILGLAEIGATTGILCLLIYLINITLDRMVKRKWVKKGMMAVTILLFFILSLENTGWDILISGTDKLYLVLVYTWLLLFMFFLDLPRFTLVTDLLEPHMVFWAIYLCLVSAGTIQHYNEEKERSLRVSSVKLQLLPQKDFEFETRFPGLEARIRGDKLVRNFVLKPTLAGRRALDKKFYSAVLPPVFGGRFESWVYLYDANGHGLYNKDSVSIADFQAEKLTAEKTKFPDFYYRGGIRETHIYLGFIPLGNDSGIASGYAVIDVENKQEETGTVYPELLQAEDHTEANTREYAIGYYINGKLADQTGDYPFLPTVNFDSRKKKDETCTIIRNNITEIYSALSGESVVCIVHYHSFIIEIITLFSYLFVIQVLIAGIAILYQVYVRLIVSRHIRRRVTRLNLRRRVHFSMLGVVLLSFVLIGIVTIIFFENQYIRNNGEKLQGAMWHARQAVQEQLERQHGLASPARFDTITRSASVKMLLATIASGEKIDLNLYNAKGMLVNTSEDDIYEKGLIAPVMRPEAYYQMRQAGKLILIQEENVSGLHYLSAYLALRNDKGVTSGYINVPFFSSEKELKFQISNIVVTLINLYAFIFLLSGLLAVFVTRWITASFNVIVRQFSKLNLARNERIAWPYDDEIAVLVTEYNKMVDKVETQATELARSERESAWREMARQVAHEIKNPLTPMKLNLQYLQRAVKSDTSVTKEMIDKISGTIIEQIDNLSYIANEFSNFARMPDAAPEYVDLADLLENAVQLYSNDGRVRVTLSLEGTGGMKVYCDRSQVMRVVTNLLENAYQAIPDGIAGQIIVRLAVEGASLVVSVSDTGVGISEEIRAKIFQPYFTSKSSGTGLGLAMTRKIIEFWNGEIWFETETGKGTTFFVRLPLSAGEIDT